MISSQGSAGIPPPKPQDPVPELLRDLIREKTGIHFENERIPLMLEKLEPRAIANGCTSYLAYYYILKYEESGPSEWRRVMDAFSVQETYFWREFDQIRSLVDHVLPAWFKQTSSPFRIWSAACATGEEPYSIVMALREAGFGNHPIEVYASDASEAALAKAQASLYRERSFRSLPGVLREKYFRSQGDSFLLLDDIRARVSFHWANLVTLEEAREIPPVNVIFCRNVFIYFSVTTIKRTLESFAKRLPLHGHLMVGASESLLKITHQFDLQELGGAFTYVRNDRP